MATLLQDIVALLAISNPLGALPVFLAITEGMTPAERSRAGLRAGIAATAILAAAALAGRPILAAFGISMPALQAAGGLVILLMGLKCSTRPDQSAARPRRTAIDGGPGRGTACDAPPGRPWRHHDRPDVILPRRLVGGTMRLLVAVVMVGATIAVILVSAARLGSLIGTRGQRILLRFMGLILAAVGAEVLLAGVYTFVPRP